MLKRISRQVVSLLNTEGERRYKFYNRNMRTWAKYKLLFVLFFISCLGCKIDSTKKSDNRLPNIVVIFADDLGYADVGYLGNTTVKTPHIDAIAKTGVTFTHGYVTASVCGPSRAALLTGRYQQRFGCEDNPAPYKRNDSVRVGIPLKEKIIAERLKKMGYSTAVFGKWHAGGERGDTSLMPNNRGFDEFYGFLEGAALYIDSTNTEQKYMRNGKEVKTEYRYFTDAIGDEACRFVEENSDKPFFLYLPFSAVHAPLQATESYLEPFSDIKNKKRKTMLAMLYAMDVNIGRVMDKIDQKGLGPQTLVFFMSDNGGQPTDNYSYNKPLRGTKGSYYEGGIRVPFAAKWEGVIREGMSYELPVSSLDIAATIYSVTGIDTLSDKNLHLDGKNMLGYLAEDNQKLPHPLLFWKLGNQSAVRDSAWKLVEHGDRKELFHLATDPYELEDVLADYPDVEERLEATYREWDSKNIPASYGFDKNIFPVLDERTRRNEFAK